MRQSSSHLVQRVKVCSRNQSSRNGQPNGNQDGSSTRAAGSGCSHSGGRTAVGVVPYSCWSGPLFHSDRSSMNGQQEPVGKGGQQKIDPQTHANVHSAHCQYSDFVNSKKNFNGAKIWLPCNMQKKDRYLKKYRPLRKFCHLADAIWCC